VSTASGNVLHAVESLARARAAEADPAMVAAAVAYGVAQLLDGLAAHMNIG
jgi:hypothetical protein